MSTKFLKLESILTSKVCLCTLGSAGVLYLLKRFYSQSLPFVYDEKSTVFITGCDTGLGYSMAIYCKENLNLNVIATCLSRNSVGAVNLKNRGITVEELLLENDSSIQSCYKTVEKTLKDSNLKLKIFINNAAVMTFGEFDWRPLDSIEKEIHVNILGPVKLTKLFMDIILTEKTRLINICSHCSLEALPGLVPYALSKSALLAWTNGLRSELNKYNVKVIAVIPGSFYTQSSIMTKPQYYISKMYEKMLVRPITIQEMYGEYFHTYLTYVQSIAKYSIDKDKPIFIEDGKVLGNIHNALTDQNPRALYMCNNELRYRFYHGLFRLLPISYFKDRIITYFMQMPAYA